MLGGLERRQILDKKMGGLISPPGYLKGTTKPSRNPHRIKFKILVSSLLRSDLHTCGASCHRDPQRVDHHPGVEETEQAYIL